MRSAALALVSVCALAACNPSAPGGATGGQFPTLNQTPYRLEATIIADNDTRMPVVMIRDGQKMRVEMSGPQGTNTIISDAATGETLSLVSMGGRQMALRMSADQVNDPTVEWQSELAATATFTGPCAAAGETGGQWTNQADGHTDTVCVTGDGIILGATLDGRATWETTSVQRGPQSADLFTLPAGVEVTDLGQMGAAMEDALARAKAAAGQ